MRLLFGLVNVSCDVLGKIVKLAIEASYGDSTYTQQH